MTVNTYTVREKIKLILSFRQQQPCLRCRCLSVILVFPVFPKAYLFPRSSCQEGGGAHLSQTGGVRYGQICGHATGRLIIPFATR